MITVHAQLKDKQSNQLEARDIFGHTYTSVILAATFWGRDALMRTDDPDAYVQYTFTQSREDSNDDPS